MSQLTMICTKCFTQQCVSSKCVCCNAKLCDHGQIVTTHKPTGVRLFQCSECECVCSMEMPERIAQEHVKEFGKVVQPDTCLASGDNETCKWEEVKDVSK